MTRGRKHYHVMEGMQGGYMPDTNDIVWTRSEAFRRAKDMARDARSEMRCRVKRIPGFGFALEGGDCGSLGRYVEVSECSEKNCATESDY